MKNSLRSYHLTFSYSQQLLLYKDINRAQTYQVGDVSSPEESMRNLRLQKEKKIANLLVVLKRVVESHLV